MLSCHNIVFLSVFVFFFQAEDGIRDTSVTGVQTCALPIFGTLREVPSPDWSRSSWSRDGTSRSVPSCGARSMRWRSEERRVGKEGRRRGLELDARKRNSLRREEVTLVEMVGAFQSPGVTAE